MTKKRKIVFHLNNLSLGGAERVVTTLANYFASKEYQVYIATEETVEREYAIDKRIKRVHVGLAGRQEKGSRAAKFLYRIKNLRKFLKKERPDMLIAFARKANYRALIANAFLKIPVIVSVRTDPYLSYNSIVDKLLISLLFSKAAGNVCQTEQAKSFFSPAIQKHSKVILNPINDKYIGLPTPFIRRKAIVHSGRIVDSKNQKMLIEAFVLVHQKHPDYCLEIYGEDSGDGTWEKLEHCIEENDAGEYVFLMGASDELEKRMIDASVFAFPSNIEGLPNALMEAMALGLPVISTDCPCGGPKMLIRDGINGLLVQVGDTEAMASGIRRLIEDRKLAEALGSKAKEICKTANVEVICRQWQEYIEELCKKR